MKERTVRWGEEEDREGDKMMGNREREEEREGEMEGGRERRMEQRREGKWSSNMQM